jgi:hypothetical protein
MKVLNFTNPLLVVVPTTYPRDHARFYQEHYNGSWWIYRYESDNPIIRFSQHLEDKLASISHISEVY